MECRSEEYNEYETVPSSHVTGSPQHPATATHCTQALGSTSSVSGWLPHLSGIAPEEFLSVVVIAPITRAAATPIPVYMSSSVSSNRSSA
jgi:hypothetical protein